MVVLGIDVSKSKFDVALLVEGKFSYKEFSNNPLGFEKLSLWLKKNNVTQLHACLEATGSYGEALALFLHSSNHQVSVVNPSRIQAFAKCQMSRNKTDKADAALIASFCFHFSPKPWTPPSIEQSQLQALVRHLDNLREARQQHLNRLEAGVDSKSQVVSNSIKRVIKLLEQEIADIEAEIGKHISSNVQLKQQKDLLTSIPGIGATTAAKFLAEIVDINVYSSVKQLDAYAGMTPKQHTSGSSVKRATPLSRMGNSKLRKAFYFPAIVAKRRNPIVKDMCLRLAEKGKVSMVIIGAAMRKLLHLAYGVLKSGKPFDPDYLSKSLQIKNL